jgi:hypothetical protein
VTHYGRVTVQTVSRRADEMGGAFDVINATFADAAAAAGIGSLLVAYRSWRGTRTQAPVFTIEKDGVTVVVDQGSEHEIRQILSVMLPDAGTADHAGAIQEDPGER